MLSMFAPCRKNTTCILSAIGGVAVVLLSCLGVPDANAQGTPIPFVQPQFFTNDGDPCNGCLLNAYGAGGTTRQDTFSDITLATANANPVVMTSAGRPTSGYIYLSATSYRFVLTDSTGGTTYWDADNTPSIPATAVGFDITSQTAGVALAAGDVVYLSDGSGSLTAGRWYLADADLTYASSQAGTIGMVPTAIASGATGTIRIGGRLTGLAGLTTGTDYYVSQTAGDLTGTAPLNAGFVGTADTTTSLVIVSNPAHRRIDNHTSDGRLTLTSATPVTTADVTGATSIFYTQYTGDRVALYTDSRWTLYRFTEVTLALGTLTSGLPYDVFLYDNAGALTLEATAWSNGTTRATALTQQDGVYVRTGALTRRYLGTFYTTSTTQTEDSYAKRLLWNYYHRVRRPMRAIEDANSWAYTTATWRQANADTANQLEFVVGVAEVMVEARVAAMCSNATAATTTFMSVGIGVDSTTSPVANSLMLVGQSAVNDFQVTALAEHREISAVGRHIWVWLEISTAAGTTTFYGDNGATTRQSGIVGSLEG